MLRDKGRPCCKTAAELRGKNLLIIAEAKNMSKSKLYKKIREMEKEFSRVKNIAMDLAIENCELKNERDDKNEIIKSLKNLLKNLERILEITEKHLIKKDVEVEILKMKLEEVR